MNKEELNKLCGEITEKLDNTAEYENWLIIQDYIDQQDQIIREARKYVEKFIPVDNDTILMREKQRDYLLEILDRNVK